MISILTVDMKGSQLHLSLPGVTPEKLCTMLWWAFDREPDVKIKDIGRLAMWAVVEAAKIDGACLLGTFRGMADVTKATGIGMIYSVYQPKRSIMVSMTEVIIEDEDIGLLNHYNGPFLDFKKNLRAILDNSMGET